MTNKPENKTIEQIRDELCEQIADEHMSPYKFCDKDNATVYDITYFCAQDGFDKSTAIHQERTKKLVEALDIIPDLITLLDNGDDSELSQYTNEIYDLAKALQEFKGEK